MKNLFRLFIFLCASSLATLSQSGPINTSQLNSDLYVGQVQGIYPTIQSAVSKGCSTITGGRVIIAIGSMPSDSISDVVSGCTKVTIEDQRISPIIDYIYGTPISGIYNPIPITPVGSQYHLGGFVGSLTGNSNYLMTNLAYTTDPTGKDLLGVRNETTTGYHSSNVTNPTLTYAEGPSYATRVDTELFNLAYTSNMVGQESWARDVTFTGPGGINYGNGFSETGAPWTRSNLNDWNATFNRRGITQWLSGTLNKNAPGDVAGFYLYLNSVLGNTGFSDESGAGISQRMSEISTYAQGTVLTGATTGTTSLPVSLNATPCDGCFVVKTNAPTITANLAGVFVTGGTYSNYWVAPITGGTVTPSTAYGNLACPGSLPQLANQNTPESITCHVLNLAGSTATFVAGQYADIGAAQAEQVLISTVTTPSAGSQDVTFIHRNPNVTLWYAGSTYKTNASVSNGTVVFRATTGGVAGNTVPAWNNTIGQTTTDGSVIWTATAPTLGYGPATLWQGGIQGTVQCHDYYLTLTGQPQCETLFGATDSTHIVGGVNYGGGMIAPYSTYETPAAVTSVTRTGSVVSMTLTNVALGSEFNMAPSAVIAGCTDATLNTTLTNLTWSKNSATITGTQSGADSTCTTATISFPPSFTAIHIYPEAEQIAGYANNGIISIEASPINWTVGDTFMQPHPPTGGWSGRWNTITTIKPGQINQSHGVGTLDYFSGASIGNGFNEIWERNFNPANIYIGGGGHILAPGGVILNGPNSGALAADLPMGDNTFGISFACQSQGCSNDTEHIMSVLGIAGHGEMDFIPSTKTWNFDNISTNNITATSFATTNLNVSSLIAATGSITNGLTIGPKTAGGLSWLTFINPPATNVGIFGLCEYYGTGNDDLCSGTVVDTQSGVYAPQGRQWAGAFNSSISSTLNGLSVTANAPSWKPTIVYNGAVGTVQYNYYYVGITPTGTTMAGGPSALGPVSTNGLSSSNNMTITCPTTLQYGYPVGSTYLLVRTTGTSFINPINLGICPLGSTVVDNGSVTTAYVFPTYSATAPLYAGAATINSLKITSGITNGVGAQLVQIDLSTCGTMTVGSSCVVTVPTSVTQPDSLYIVTGCTPSSAQAIYFGAVTSQTTTNFSATIWSNAAQTVTGTLSCFVSRQQP